MDRTSHFKNVASPDCLPPDKMPHLIPIRNTAEVDSGDYPLTNSRTRWNLPCLMEYVTGYTNGNCKTSCIRYKCNFHWQESETILKNKTVNRPIRKLPVMVHPKLVLVSCNDFKYNDKYHDKDIALLTELICPIKIFYLMSFSMQFYHLFANIGLFIRFI